MKSSRELRGLELGSLLGKHVRKPHDLGVLGPTCEHNHHLHDVGPGVLVLQEHYDRPCVRGLTDELRCVRVLKLGGELDRALRLPTQPKLDRVSQPTHGLDPSCRCCTPARIRALSPSPRSRRETTESRYHSKVPTDRMHRGTYVVMQHGPTGKRNGRKLRRSSSFCPIGRPSTDERVTTGQRHEPA